MTTSTTSYRIVAKCTSKELPLEVQKTNTINDIKLKLKETHLGDCPKESIFLVFCGKLLQPSRTLEYCGIGSEAMVSVFVKHPNKKDKKYRLAVAIDFGTDGTALSFADIRKNEVLSRHVWNEHGNDQRTQQGNKLPTNILIKRVKLSNEEKTRFSGFERMITQSKEKCNEYLNWDNEYKYETVAYGNEAFASYRNLCRSEQKVDDDENADYLYFEKFKMNLYDKNTLEKPKNIDPNAKIKSANGIEVSTQIVFIEALKWIKYQAIQIIKQNTPNNELELGTDIFNDIQWIITVPAIWNDDCKSFMHQWLIYSEMVDLNRNKKPNEIFYGKYYANFPVDQIVIKNEPECAAVEILHHFNNNNNNENTITPKSGDLCLVLDLGGGTADIACNQILDKYHVSQVFIQTGGDWGSRNINLVFLKILDQLFGKDNIDELKVSKPDVYMELLDQFETQKKLFFESKFSEGRIKSTFNDNKKISMPLSTKFYDFMNTKIDDFEEYINNKKIILDNKEFNECFELEDDTQLKIKYKLWFYMFDLCIDKIISHLKNILSNNTPLQFYSKNKDNNNFICLVGGFSSSSYLQYKLYKEFSIYKDIQGNEINNNNGHNFHIIVPPNPITSVVQGAARTSLTAYNGFVYDKKLTYSYGCKVCAPIQQAKQIYPNMTNEFIKKNKVIINIGRIENPKYVDNIWFIRYIAKKYDTIKVEEPKSEMFVYEHGSNVEVYRSANTNEYDPSKCIQQGVVDISKISENENDILEQGDVVMVDFMFKELLYVYVRRAKSRPKTGAKAIIAYDFTINQND